MEDELFTSTENTPITSTDISNESYRVVAHFSSGRKSMFDYVESVTYNDNGTITLRGREDDDRTGSMIRRDFELERANIDTLEKRVIAN